MNAKNKWVQDKVGNPNGRVALFLEEAPQFKREQFHGYRTEAPPRDFVPESAAQLDFQF